jgi:predicted RNA binding protein YcfA (HicA-like mRNA interferase family)
MSKLPAVSSRECVRALEKAGFSIISQNGSHIKMRRDNPYSQVIVNQTKALAPGTLRSILRSAGLTIDEFIGLL